MAPNGPSLTSQARAAELNAATAARARLMSSELADMNDLPSSQPISLADFTMRNKGPRQSKAYQPERVESHEQFKRPNRPVDRYFPPAPPVSLHPYPVQYADPRMAMYSPGPYPVSEYYYPVYQGVSTYHQVYPNHMNNDFSAGPPPGTPVAGPLVAGPPPGTPVAGPLVAGPLVAGPPPGTPVAGPLVAGPPVAGPSAATPVAGRSAARPLVVPPAATPVAGRSAARPLVVPPATPLVTPSVAPPATPPVAPPVSPEKKSSPAKVDTPKSSPSKSAEQATQTFFRPQDLSPSNWEEELIRFKAAAALTPPANEKQTNGVIQQRSGAGVSPGKTAEANGHSGHQKGGLKLDESSQKPTPSTKDSDGIQNSRVSSPSTNLKETSRQTREKNGTTKLELASPIQILRKSPQRDQPAIQAFHHSAQQLPKPDNVASTDDKPTKSLNVGVGTKDNGSTEQQELKLDNGESHNMNISQKDTASLFSMPAKLSESSVSPTPLSGPRRLQSPFKHRVNPPVKYYTPIVNKYPKNVFESEATRLEALRSIDNETTWREFQRAPKVEGLPGPFKGFPDFPMSADRSPLLRNNGAVMPPPGLAASNPMPVPRSKIWNPKIVDADYASAYYDRVLAAEDWFHQSISKKDNSSSKFQRKLDEERAMLYIANGKPHNLTTPAMASQTTNAFKLAFDHLSSYMDSEEDKKRSFGFSGYGRRHVRHRTFASDSLDSGGPEEPK